MNTVRQAPSSGATKVNQILVANNARRQLLISNSTAGVAYVNFTTTTPSSSSHQLKLAAGENMIIDSYNGPATSDQSVVFTEFI